MMEEIVFDMEVYPNWWCLVYSNPENTKVGVITSDDSDYLAKISNIRICKCLIGFNIKGYDLRILNAIINGSDPKDVYECSQAIIYDTDHVFNNYFFWTKFNFSDLFDDWKFGSLKEFESNMGMPIVETSVDFSTEELSIEDKFEIIKYCKHDVKATCKLLEVRREYVDAKKVLSEMFNIPIDKALKSTVAKLSSLILGAKKRCYEDDTRFKIPSKVESYIRRTVPAEIIEMFTYLNDDDKSARLFENDIVYGEGGIHSTCGNNILVMSDKDYVLLNVDAENYYPMLSINFNFLSRNVKNPAKYSEMVMLSRRLKADYKKELALNGETELYKVSLKKRNAIKLPLNATYGAEKNEYNELYDPYNATSMCYLGQLLLTGLAHELYQIGAKIIQTNTDGILIKVLRSDVSKAKEIVTNWVILTDIPVGYEEIELFFQRDVNNYIEIETSGKQKLKGKWSNQAEETLSNLNAPVTHQAVLDYYTKKIPVEDTVNNCMDPIAFCFTAKTGYTYDKTYYYIDDKPIRANKINRVVATTDTRYGTIRKYKKYWVKRDENNKLRACEQYDDGAEEREKYDKIAEIPEHSLLMNDDLYLPKTLDRQWYIDFAKNKIKELEIV